MAVKREFFKKYRRDIQSDIITGRAKVGVFFQVTFWGMDIRSKLELFELTIDI
ncbi:hypothetical protein GCM10009597_31430 [Peribacillus frigoritolerans]